MRESTTEREKNTSPAPTVDFAQLAARLSAEQRAVVESWGRGMAVLAGAGSGKTTTLVVKCGELLRRQPDAKLCAVSFTERSASDLREKLSALAPLAGHWVMTIHGLCGAIIREFPRQAGYHGDERMLSEPEAQTLWERATEGLWFEEVPPQIHDALELLLERESRPRVVELLGRLRELANQGALPSLGSRAEDPASIALFRLAGHVLDRYERLKRRQGAIDFGDLETGADRALEFEEVRTRFHERFALVMVDEFQDTNPLQARIVFRFCRPDFSNLCVVGDPKQSIYRFRDADVGVFEECCRMLPERRALTWNFRSRPGIIELSNRVCAPAFAASAMEYEALVPRREPDPKIRPAEVLEDATPDSLARWVASERARGVRLGDMALLLRRIRGKEEWLKALAAAGIPVAVGSGGLFWEDPRVRELTAFLKWWDDPANALSGAIFLRAPWVGVADAELDGWLLPGPEARGSGLGLQERFFASGHPLARALAPLREDGARALRPGEVLMRLLVDEAIERELGTQLLGLWHRCEELSARGLDFHRVVAELARALEERRRERDVPPPRAEDGPGQLLVLTVHASKGLEFPHVLLLDFPEAGERARAAPLLFWDRKRGAFLGKRDEAGERDRKAEQSWREEEKQQELAESKRVFYVALTRARERLVLVYPRAANGRGALAAAPGASDASVGEAPGPEVVEKASPPRERRAEKALGPEVLGPEVLGKDHWRGWIETGAPGLPRLSVPEQLVAPPRAEGEEGSTEKAGADELRPAREAGGFRVEPPSSTPAAPELVRPRHSATEWNLLTRCPRAYEWTLLRPPGGGAARRERERIIERTTERAAERSGGEGISQRELGSRVHACLEKNDVRGLRLLVRERPDFDPEALIAWAGSAECMLPAGSEPDGERAVWTELGFEVPVAGEVLVGAMDRVVHWRPTRAVVEREAADPGRYQLIDFKITRKLKAEQELLADYASQLRIYAWALGALEPEARDRTEACLVAIAEGEVREVAVALPPYRELTSEIEALAREAGRWVNRPGAPPRPGSACRHCDFKRICPEAVVGAG